MNQQNIMPFQENKHGNDLNEWYTMGKLYTWTYGNTIHIQENYTNQEKQCYRMGETCIWYMGETWFPSMYMGETFSVKHQENTTLQQQKHKQLPDVSLETSPWLRPNKSSPSFSTPLERYWVNYNNSLSWNEVMKGDDFPIKAMVPVRESSEIVIIYTDVWIS